ncbi:FliH/SctL family protein [Granulicella sp. S190]|uniref:FliH/SctL family protein n=1 Tax=Granulicella sp. S190 TaxID=1747226 RepID=UPI00131C5EF0|nr:FliH/SctL family protein [Granulicella sp. S190]
MISPSEDVCAEAGGRGLMELPERLMKPVGRSVSRLEFHAWDRPAAESEVVVEEKVAAVEILTKDEAGAAEAQMRSLEEQMTKQIAVARAEGVAEARLRGETEFTERIAEERSRLRRVEEEFGRERTRYFSGVEGEVVRLALAIAARVLHREAQLDPLLLTGVVRVALEKVAKDSAVVVRVPANELERWDGVFAGGQHSALKLLGDEGMAAGECVLETNVGRVELGVSAQLEEIERGFFDLMQQRPA